MKFGPVPIEQAVGKILVHNVTAADGRRALRKGKPLLPQHIDVLRGMGRSTVYVAELEQDDVDENEAARLIATALCGKHMRLSGPATGRSNLYSTELGLVRVDFQRLLKLNSLEGVTLATLPTHTTVKPGKMIATLKILPYAIPRIVLSAAVAASTTHPPLLAVTPLPKRHVTLLLSGSDYARERVVASFSAALGQRITALGSKLVEVDFVPLNDEQDERELAARLQQAQKGKTDLIILAGETAITDRYDIAPRAVERAGGEVVGFGAPVDPGNLLMLGYLKEIPIVGAPGCSRSPKENIVDLVLPRLLAGDRLTRRDIVALGHGGLLEDVPERPLPRSRID